MKSLTFIDWIAVILTIVGGVNWGLVGIFGANGNVVNMILGNIESIERVVYIVVGISAIYLMYVVSKIAGSCSSSDESHMNQERNNREM